MRSEIDRVKKSGMSGFGNKNVRKKNFKIINIWLKYRQKLNHTKGQKYVFWIMVQKLHPNYYIIIVYQGFSLYASFSNIPLRYSEKGLNADVESADI